MPPRRTWYPLLFAVQPVLSLYVTNSTEVRFAAVLLPLLAALGFAAVLLLALHALMRDSTRAALVTSLVVIGFFSFGYATRAWSNASLPGEPRLVVGAFWGLIVTVLSVAIVRTRIELDGVGRFAAALAFIVTVLPPLQLAVRWARTRDDSALSRSAESDATRKPSPLAARDDPPGRASQTPDIYYIVLDGYARHDAMREIYGFDNAPFRDWHLQGTACSTTTPERATSFSSLRDWRR